MLKLRNQLLLFGRDPMDFPNSAATRTALHESFDQWMQRAVAIRQMGAQKFSGKLDRGEPMLLAGTARGLQRISSRHVKPRGQRLEIHGAFLATHGAVAGHVQAKLNAIGMKTG